MWWVDTCRVSELHFLRTKLYFNIKKYLRWGDTWHVGTCFKCPLITGFTVCWEPEWPTYIYVPSGEGSSNINESFFYFDPCWDVFSFAWFSSAESKELIDRIRKSLEEEKGEAILSDDTLPPSSVKDVDFAVERKRRKKKTTVLKNGTLSLNTGANFVHLCGILFSTCINN